MAKKKDLVFTNFYRPHLNGGHGNNPAMNQQLLTERMYTRVLGELCANRFKWEGLPKEISHRSLELNLFWRALAVFFKDNTTGKFMALRASGTGGLNYQDDPVKFTVTGNGGVGADGNNRPYINQTISADDCVPIWANYMRTPDLDIVSLYAHKLAKFDRTIEINADAMRYTSVITAEENERNSWVNIMRQHAEGQPVIFGTQALDMSKINAFNISPHPESLPNLMIAKSKLWNECMGLLGINNANQDKKERLVAAEVGANDEQVAAARNINMNAREFASEQINEMFGLNVSVSFMNEADAAQEDTFDQKGTDLGADGSE